MKTTPDLFNLIKSLDKNEKRYFKLFATLYSGEKNYINLYDAIEAQEEYDENKIREIFKDQPFLNQLSVAKNYLYNLILKSLEIYHSTIDSEFRSLLTQSEILYNKNLYNECRKHLARAKKIAEKYQNTLQIIEVMLWELYLLANDDAEERMAISEKVAELGEHIISQQKFRILNSKMFVIYKNRTHARKLDVIKKAEEIMKDERLKSDKPPTTYIEKMLYYNTKANYHYIKGDFQQSYKLNVKQQEVYEQNPQLLEKTIGNYISAVNNTMIRQAALEKWDEVEKSIKKIRSLTPHLLKDKVHGFEYTHICETHMALKTGDFDRVISKVPDIVASIKGFGGRVSTQSEAVLYMNISEAYFAVENYNKALEWINKAMHVPATHGRTDLLSFMRIFNLIVHVELRNNDLLEHAVKSLYRYLSKRDILFKFESIVLSFIKKKAPRIYSREDRVNAYKELKANIEELLKDPIESLLIEYFDFISWADSKIQGRPYAEIIRSKRK